jgi:hypothetical protein
MMRISEMDLEEVEKMMEEMANCPKEEMGKRQPGEIGAYERYNRDRYYAKQVMESFIPKDKKDLKYTEISLEP